MVGPFWLQLKLLSSMAVSMGLPMSGSSAPHFCTIEADKTRQSPGTTPISLSDPGLYLWVRDDNSQAHSVERKVYLALVGVCCCNETLTKSNSGRKASNCLTLLHHSPSLREPKVETQGWNLELETKAEPLRNAAYWLALLACLACILVNLPSSVAHSGRGPPISTINKQNAPTDMFIGQSDRGNSSGEVPSSRVTLICVKSMTT